MADDLTKTGKPDRIRISLTQTHELRYWRKALHTTNSDLREIVRRVGAMVADVKKYMIERIEQA